MIENVELRYWEEGAQYVAASFAKGVPLHYRILTDQQLSLVPYATMLRDAQDCLINNFNENLRDGETEEVYDGWRAGYTLMFEVALTCIWELYSYASPGIIINEVLELIAAKQNDYGPMNIWSFKHPGLVIRMNDKVARLENLAATKRKAENESVLDTFYDLVGYSIIGGMLLEDVFLLPLKKKDQNG